MKTFFTALIGGTVLLYALLLILGALLGNAGMLIAGLLAAGALFAALACVVEQLDRIEGKLDRLLRERTEDQGGG